MVLINDMYDVLKLSWEIGLGNDQPDENPSNPLSRTLNRLMDEGKPFKRLIMCFWNADNDENRKIGSQSAWISAV